MSTPRRHISLLKPGGVDQRTYLPKPDAQSGAGPSEGNVHGGAGAMPPRSSREQHGGRRAMFTAIALVLLVLLGAVLSLVFVGASLSAGSSALASIGLPLSGGTVERVTVVTGPHSRSIPIRVQHQEVWPRVLLPVGERVSVEAVVKRPGWISWLAGSRERVRLSLVTPSTNLLSQYVTLAAGAPLRVHYDAPVATVSYGPEAPIHRVVLSPPRSEVGLPRSGAAGSILVAATPRTWESANALPVSYFPPGTSAAAVASPSPGTHIQPNAPIALTFSEPWQKALGNAKPAISPATPGAWTATSSHTLVFNPTGYGYGLGATVTIALPSGVRLVGGEQGASAATASWTVPEGSTLRLQQLLAQLGYLPLRFRESGGAVPASPQAQEAAALNPPAGQFTWRYGNVPSTLRGFWEPGASGVMTRGAVMAFENEHEITNEGAITGTMNGSVWKALIAAAVAHHVYTFGYSFVNVSESSQSLVLWHNGRQILTTPVNTGIESRPTEPGTFPVYLHESSGTMSGTNPDGSHYEDAGVPWISYFNGGDALHGFERASYGFPQSLGCVEMPISTAGEVWPYTPVGTLVNVQGI
jgi:L,D-transpeptidase catalytic domain